MAVKNYHSRLLSVQLFRCSNQNTPKHFMIAKQKQLLSFVKKGPQDFSMKKYKD